MKDQLEALVAQMHTTGILYSEAVREFKKRFIMNILRENKGNQCKAARELGMHRNTLCRMIGELKLDVRQFRDGWQRREKTSEDVTSRIRQTVDVTRKPARAVYVERCKCTGRGWHILYGLACTKRRPTGAVQGA